MKSPIFIFSLPRAGSTLLQRVLMSHTDIASVAEPWLLLSYLYTRKQHGIVTDFSQPLSSLAIEDFINNLPKQEEDYMNALRTFITTLYAKQCRNNEVYFLDKTPRYYFIIPEIARIFPDAKFIFLFRNPVHVMSSVIQTWGDGNLSRLYHHEDDLHFGPQALSQGHELIKDKAFALRYEDYVEKPEKHLRALCAYLEIPYDDTMHNAFQKQDTKGRMGDTVGTVTYDNISSSSLEKWRDTFNTPFRKKILLRYINSIDETVLSVQGYDKKTILQQIRNHTADNRNILRDRFDWFFSSVMKKINIANYQKTINGLESLYRRLSRFLNRS